MFYKCFRYIYNNIFIFIFNKNIYFPYISFDIVQIARHSQRFIFHSALDQSLVRLGAFNRESSSRVVRAPNSYNTVTQRSTKCMSEKKENLLKVLKPFFNFFILKCCSLQLPHICIIISNKNQVIYKINI